MSCAAIVVANHVAKTTIDPVVQIGEMRSGRKFDYIYIQTCCSALENEGEEGWFQVFIILFLWVFQP